MQPGSSREAVVVALIVAIVGTAVLVKMDLGPRNASE